MNSNGLLLLRDDVKVLKKMAPDPFLPVGTATTNGVKVCSPAAGSSVGAPVRFTAAARSTHPITAMRIYIDTVSAYFTKAANLDVSLPVSSGSHFVVVQAWDSGGVIMKTPLTIKVGSSTGTGTGCSASPSASLYVRPLLAQWWVRLCV